VDGAIRVARGSDRRGPRETVLGLHVDRFGVRHRIRPDGYAGQQPAGVRVSHVRHHRTHDAGRHAARDAVATGARRTVRTWRTRFAGHPVAHVLDNVCGRAHRAAAVR